MYQVSYESLIKLARKLLKTMDIVIFSKTNPLEKVPTILNKVVAFDMAVNSFYRVSGN